MVTTLKRVVVISLLTVVGSERFALAADKPALREDKAPAIEIAQINPSKGDIWRIEKRRKQMAVPSGEEDQVYVIKIYMDMPSPGAQGCILYIGDEKIKEYGGFAEAVFFKAYDLKQLRSWQGKLVRILYRNEMIDLKVTVPPKPDKTPAKLPTLSEALRNENSR